MKVLINLPYKESPGGVTNHFKTLELNKIENLEYFLIYKSNYNSRITRNPIYLIYRCIMFFFIVKKYDVVHLNPSFKKNSLWRDSIFLNIAKLSKKKVIVFFHGWDNSYEQKIIKNQRLLRFFQLYNKANAIIVNGEIFKNKLINLGISKNKKFYIESTIADDKFIDKPFIDNKLWLNGPKEEITFLFLSRIVKDKGMDLALSIFQILQNTFSHKSFNLIFAGDGNMLDWTKKYVKSNKIKNVTFTGYVRDMEKHKLFIDSDIMLFPTKYGEGLPNAIMQGCLYGLPIITRSEGAISEWIVTGENGYSTKSTNPEDFAKYIQNLINDPILYNKMVKNNHDLAKQTFTPSKVITRYQKIYDEIYKTNV